MNINDKEIEYWMNEYPDLDQEEIIDIIESMDLDSEANEESSFRMTPQEEADPFQNMIQNVFTKLNKKKSIDIDD